MARKREVVTDDACCPPNVLDASLDEDSAAVISRTFAAVSDPVRLRLLSLVADRAPGEICACDLTGPAGRSQPTVSHHMKVLFEAGLIDRQKRGLWVWYRPTEVGVQLARWAHDQATTSGSPRSS